MNERVTDETVPAKKFVLGSKSFAAITAVEGLKLRSDSEERLERTSCLTQEQRRAETIRAFAGVPTRGWG
jgi:hypothetical protein